jgi:hypothetical protein
MKIKNNTESKDSQKSPKNVCPICEEFGLPICRGHGGGGSGGSSDEKEEKHHAKKTHANSTSQIIMSLVLHKSSPEYSPGLAFPEIVSIACSPSALGIEFDVDNHRLSFSRGTLSIEAFNMFKELLQSAIEEIKESNPDLAKQLKSISVIADNEKIIIQMPSMKLFNLFIKQLMDENLLPRLRVPAINIERQNQSSSIDSGITEQKTVYANSHNKTRDSSKSTAPNPFSMRPVPVGYSTE